jgi:hypothetical protein
LNAKFENWVLQKVQPRAGKNGPILCRTAALLRVPKTIGLDQEAAERELTRLREAGVIACTNGVWWQRRTA